MPAYLIALTPLQRSRLKGLLAEVAGEDMVIDTISQRLSDAEQVSDSEARRLIGMETDDGKLDWDWIESLRVEWSQASLDEWTTAEVLQVVMASGRKKLWQPRTA